MRLKFGLDEVEATERTCIIVVEIDSGEGVIQTGIIVDSVSEVLNIRGEDIEEAPSFGASVDTEYILGMAKMDGQVKILLEIDKVLSQSEVKHLGQVG